MGRMTYQIRKEKKTKNLGKRKPICQGVKMNPKLRNHTDLIEVKEIIIINPSLKEKVLKLQFQVAFRRLFKIVMDNIEEDGTNTDANIVLDELLKAKKVLQKKYKDQIKNEEYRIMWNKISLLEKEVKNKLILQKQREEMLSLYNEEIKEEKKGRGR